MGGGGEGNVEVVVVVVVVVVTIVVAVIVVVVQNFVEKMEFGLFCPRAKVQIPKILL